MISRTAQEIIALYLAGLGIAAFLFKGQISPAAYLLLSLIGLLFAGIFAFDQFCRFDCLRAKGYEVNSAENFFLSVIEFQDLKKLPPADELRVTFIHEGSDYFAIYWAFHEPPEDE